MRKTLFLMGLLMPLFLLSQQIPKSTYTGNGERIGFLEYKPSSYNVNASTKYPVIIFLHGIGERGNGTTELNRVKNIAIPHYIDRGHPMRFYANGKWETFLVISPQCPKKYGMWPVSYVDAMVTYARTKLNADPKRIFIAGLSMGGGGTWRYASSSLANANKLAAIATVCAPPYMTNGCNIAKSNLPLWAFHASDDKTVNISSLFNAVNKINACGPGVPAIKTVWATGGHAVWDRAFDTEHKYQTPNVYEWFLGQGKTQVTTTNKKPVANAGNNITTNTPATLKLNASASKDPDGYITSYTWRKIAGPSNGFIANAVSAVSKLVGIKTAGSYSFELKVTDNKGSWDKDTVKAIVTANASKSQDGRTPGGSNRPPTARAGKDQLIIAPKNSALINGTTSTDPDKKDWIASFRWTKIGGPSSYRIAKPSAGKTMIYDLKPGYYRFRLTVKDGKGATAIDDVAIEVNAPPKAKAGPDKTITLPVNFALLNGTTSTDPGGWVKSFRWTKVNGPGKFSIASSGSGKTMVRNLTVGIYTFRLAVMDSKGVVSYDETRVQVIRKPKGTYSTQSLATKVTAQTAVPGVSTIATPIITTENGTPIVPTMASLTIYPNPASSNINIQCITEAIGKTTVIIYDFSGRQVKSIVFEKTERLFTKSIDISSLGHGLYIIDIRVNQIRVSSGKFAKQ
ncbi:MAG: PKD domain-containing protein [Flavitalea sp.]